MKSHGMTSTDWRVASTGYGSVTFDSTGIGMSPMVSTEFRETHSGLVISEQFSRNTVKNFEIELNVNTIKQLRENNLPKSWECFWLLFNYVIDPLTGKKTCNYFVVKPNGIELGTAYGELGQTFIATDINPCLKVGVSSRWRIKKTGPFIFIGIDGKQALSGRYDSMYDQPGSFGLYTEDAAVKISDFKYL